MKKAFLKLTAHTVLLSLGFQLVFPACAYALTTGPSQPEVQSFEPVGTTDMVDLFSGDFNYNIPLMDVEGYPINIAYHSGIGIEQEASWCGLGWNINPGEINRTVRGLPDDFNGEKIEREVNVNKEKDMRISTGMNLGFEVGGSDQIKLTLALGMYVGYNNYKGIGVGTNVGVSVSVPYVSAGINMGIGSQTGADVDVNAGMRTSTDIGNDATIGMSANGGTGFNSRSGLKDFTFGVSSSVSAAGTIGGKPLDQAKTPDDWKVSSIPGASYGSSIPIGLQNYVAVPTNASTVKSLQIQTKFGGEIAYLYPSFYLNMLISEIDYDHNGDKIGYGYLYSENATKEDMLDFSREKDGTYNSTLQNLPPSSMTYDIYSVSGQGTGGSFRPFRNDIGTIYDPYLTASTTKSEDVQIEFGMGNLFEVGTDLNFYENENSGGPWKMLDFTGEKDATLYEKVFFKQGGELTYNQQQQATQLFNPNAEYLSENMTSLTGKNKSSMGVMPAQLGTGSIYWANGTIDRSSRANLITYRTAAEATVRDVAQEALITSYKNNSGNNRFYDPNKTSYNRNGNTDLFATATDAKPDHISEFTQTLPDGRRYIYGIPAMNHASSERTFSINESIADLNTGLVNFTSAQNSTNNDMGLDHYYSASNTPAYAHSYLLTSVLSNDYVDILGDGPSDDDLGTFVKFNYELKSNDYRWRAPYHKTGTTEQAQYNPGFWSDNQDGKGSYLVGSRQQWMLRTVESKNYVAEFYTSARSDALGVRDAVLPGSSEITTPGLDLKTALSAEANSYKLDSIKLYNKHDRYINGDNATPVKTVILTYSYRLCPGTPNSNAAAATYNGTSIAAGGKLTLEKIGIRYGKSDKNLLSPYVFNYSSSNPAYDFAAKDRWGNYQPNNPALTNYEFPYVTQANTPSEDTAADARIGSWNLTGIKLPSGGRISVKYETDDYAFVQNKRSMEMIRIEGVGNSTKLDHKNALYEDENNINQYVYFKRRIAEENSGRSLRDNYLEGQSLLYYSFNLDITGKGKFENIKGYARIGEVGLCSDNSDYAYIKLEKDEAKGMQLHPATIYGLNMARYYLPHILYPGSKNGEAGNAYIMQGLVAAAGELISIWKNPFKRFVKEGKGKNIRTQKSWIRLQSAGLAKKGGGLRVKELVLDDNWQSMVSGGSTATYGKHYDYTINDDKYGLISSGVASYEPLVGGDENPFRMPVSWSASNKDRLMPAIDFFQEEPFCESFFPSPMVGYSSVKVTSIHLNEGGSSRALDETQFYTARDYPLEVEYTQKEAPDPIKSKSLRRTYREEKAFQGYVLRLNDMHGKLKAVDNYVLHTDGNSVAKERITGVKYNYHNDAQGKLDNKVDALIRARGTKNTYQIQRVSLGQDMDFTVDSRERNQRSYNRNIAMNLNVVIWGTIPIPLPTVFFPDKETQQIFRSMVSTKIMQQYGIVKSVENYDHGAITTTEHVLYDGETGGVLLSKTNNQYSDNTYDLKYPAYLAYQGMAPAYTNINYAERMDSLIVDSQLNGQLLTGNLDKYQPGDELIIEYRQPGLTVKKRNLKVWVVGIGLHVSYRSVDTVAVYSLLPGVQTRIDTVDHKVCCLNVLPRFKTFNQWPQAATKIAGINAKIVRSGHRNNLNQYVQQSVLASAPYVPGTGAITDLFSNSAFSKVIGTSATVFDDMAQPYAGFGNTFTDSALGGAAGATANTFTGFNPYVLGYKGNFRPAVSLVPGANRSYANAHSRHDGTYSINDNYWSFNNSPFFVCADLGRPLTPSGSAYIWKPVSSVTKYDVHGNALEERDAIGNYSAAQYGYNKSLPVAVAANARQQSFMFDGFEEYNMLVPKAARLLFALSAYQFSPVAGLLSNIADVAALNYQGGGAGYFNRYGQSYNLRSLAANGNSNLSVTQEANHTGYFSLKSTAAQSLTFAVGPEGMDSVHAFIAQTGKKYLLNCWVKNVGGGAPVISGYTLTCGGSTTAMQLKSGNIDGWYLLEGKLDLTGTPSSTVSLNLPSGIYLDDLRLLPTDANMKSFVYDPISFKLHAQLDENNMATFYEYDQEGLLVRVKKETDRGIMTVSESRRSNVKQQ